MNPDIMGALEAMIKKYPYRVLSSFTFDVPQTPLRSARLLGDDPASETIVSSIEKESEEMETESDDFSICHFPHHREFVKAVRDAEKLAKDSGVRAPYHWRGYRGYVSATLPPITIPGLQMRLMNALQGINNISVPETMVNKNCLNINYTLLIFFLSMYVNG